jgi:hypothetical protein
VRYERTERARRDYARLSDNEKQLFKDAVALLNEAYDRRGDRPVPVWPKQLRVKDVEGATGVWEMTWRWPDGRATFEYVRIANGELAIRWRRIGGHEIFREP